jgi:RNA polymerase-binding transcription factor DksA
MNHIPAVKLEEFKQQLLARKRKLEVLLHKVEEDSPSNDLNRLADNASNDTDAREEDELIQSEVMGDQLEESLERIMSALERMEKGTYGLDIETGEQIPVGRLEIDPTATHTV